MSITTEQIQGLTGKVLDQNAEKIGSIGQIYLDDTSGTPSWVTAKTGLFGSAETFVPLDGAQVSGDDLTVAFSEEQVKGAPRIESDGSLSPEEENQLYAYYGLAGADSYTGEASTGTANAGYAETDRGSDTVGHDTSGPSTDDAMTRSEERLNVGTQTREAGRARLRKFVTTETVTQSVPVSHEEVTLEREPITDANVGDATSGPSISEEEHEVVLHEEVPVVDKDVVAVERVKLGKETVTEQASVSEEVRKENIELAEPDGKNVR